MDKYISNIPNDTVEKLHKQAAMMGMTLTSYIRLVIIEAANNKDISMGFSMKQKPKQPV